MKENKCPHLNGMLPMTDCPYCKKEANESTEGLEKTVEGLQDDLKESGLVVGNYDWPLYCVIQKWMRKASQASREEALDRVKSAFKCLVYGNEFTKNEILEIVESLRNPKSK